MELNYAKFNHSAESSNYFDHCIYHLLIHFTLTMRVATLYDPKQLICVADSIAAQNILSRVNFLNYSHFER